jgi:hypothetical protein
MTDFIDVSEHMESNRHFMENMREVREAQFRRDNPVVEVAACLKNKIENFESSLDSEFEVGVRLVTFGGSITFHAQEISFSKPCLITFSGIDNDGNRVQLVQHVTQLNFLLCSLPKLLPTKQRIGFIWSN